MAEATTQQVTALASVQVIGLSPGVFRANETTPGQVHLLHGSRVVDCLYESPPEYPGVTGIFPVSLTSQDDTTAAVVISFASGSRALTTGLASHPFPCPQEHDHASVLLEPMQTCATTYMAQATTVGHSGCAAQVTPSQTSLKA